MRDDVGSSATHSRMSSSATEDDALLEERVRRRRLDQEAKMQQVPSSHVQHPHQQIAPIRTSPSKSNSNGVMPQPPSATSTSVGLLQSPSLSDDIDDEQMKKDLDFIQNFDLHHNWNRPADPNEVLINMDFTASTPPEDVPLSQTYKTLSIYNGRSLQNGTNYLNPLYVSTDSPSATLGFGANALSDVHRVTNDKNDNVILDLKLPSTIRDRAILKSHCDTSTDL